MTTIRFLVTWEAIEHDGPGEYDSSYLDYVHAVLSVAAQYGISVYIDPHQDVFSRFSGGDGAPAWTFEAAGLDINAFTTTGAATLHQTEGDKQAFPRMIWPTNCFKFACNTMFTLFFAGNTFAPKLKVSREGAEPVSIQDYLQSHYIGALGALAERLSDLPNIVGFGPMNEPLPGFIGVKDLTKLYSPLKNGPMPSAFQQMCLASGFTQRVGVYSNSSLYSLALGRPTHHIKINSEGTNLWLASASGASAGAAGATDTRPVHAAEHCVWQQHGVWAMGEGSNPSPKLLKPGYFAGHDFGTEFWIPFARAYMERVRQHLPHALCFVELPPDGLELCTPPFPSISKDEKAPNSLVGAVNATHWYDLTIRYTSYTALTIHHTP
jgi:hypothetical protein